MQTKIFKSSVKDNRWMPVINHLEFEGYDIYPTTEVCEKAIVLSGLHENATVFDGKKILIYHEVEWCGMWEFFKPVIQEYYDEMIDVTQLSIPQTVEVIKEQCN